MTDTLPADNLDRLEQLVARLERLEGHVGIDTRVATDAYGNPGHVVPGELIESAWGNAVADRVVPRFNDFTELTAGIPAPIPGQLATVWGGGVASLMWWRNGQWQEVPAQPQYYSGAIVAGPIAPGAEVVMANLTPPPTARGRTHVVYSAAAFSVADMAGVVKLYVNAVLSQTTYFSAPLVGAQAATTAHLNLVTTTTGYGPFSVQVRILNNGSAPIDTYGDPANHQLIVVQGSLAPIP